MKAYIFAILALVFGLSVGKSFGAIEGVYPGPPICRVNGVEGNHFQPGDFIQADAGAIVAVGALDPPTTFVQYMAFLADSWQFVAAHTTDSEHVQPNDFDNTSCQLGYSVPPSDYYPYYEFYTNVKYWDSTTMMYVELNAAYGYFNTD